MRCLNLGLLVIDARWKGVERAPGNWSLDVVRLRVVRNPAARAVGLELFGFVVTVWL